MIKQSLPEKKSNWYEMIPYGYGIVDPGEWFWLAYRYPPSQEEPQTPQPNLHSKKAVTKPPIRINFYARRS